jgi:hypothetical protein
MSNNYPTSSCYNVEENAIRGKLRTLGTFDHHFEDVLHRIRAEVDGDGFLEGVEIFEYVTENEVVGLIADWSRLAESWRLDRTAELYVSLRDGFRLCGVKRYVIAGEGWVCEKPTRHCPEDDECGRWVQVLAIERNGPRKYAHAEIIYGDEGSRMLGPWEVSHDIPQGPLSELLEEGDSDQAPTASSPPVLADDTPDRVYETRQTTRLDSVDLATKLSTIADQLQSGELAAMCYVTFSKSGDYEVSWTVDTFTYTCSCCGEQEEFNLKAFVIGLGDNQQNHWNGTENSRVTLWEFMHPPRS